MSEEQFNSDFVTIILAAGLGKRMRSDLPKVLHLLAGRPLVHYVIDTAKSVGSRRTILVVGHKRELVIESTARKGVEWVIQAKQLGTGDAVKACLPTLGDYAGDVLILSGDVPLLSARSIHLALALHRARAAAVTVFTFKPPDTRGYGRILRGDDGMIERIIEEKDIADDAERGITEVNAGIYLFNMDDLRRSVQMLSNENAAGEYYLTDTIALLRSWTRPAAAYLVADPLEVAGVNDADQLAELEAEYLRRSPENA